MTMMLAHAALGLDDAWDRADSNFADGVYGYADIHDTHPTDGALSNVGTQPSAIRSKHIARGTDSGGGRTYGGGGKKIGLTDTVEVDVTWDQNTLAQHGPIGHYDPATATTYWGIAFYWNIALQTWFCVGVGTHTIFDYGYTLGFPGGVMEVKARFIGNKVEGYINGTRMIGPVTVPAECQGIDGWGPWHGNATGSDQQYGKHLYARKCIVAQGSAPTTPTVDSIGTTAKAATASTIDVPYPADVTAGKLLILWVCKHNSGVMSTPAGWTASTSSKLTGAYGIQAFVKIATGSESGNLTVSGGSSSNLGGGMITVGNNHPAAAACNVGAGQANSASTTVNVPAVTNGAISRLELIIFGSGVNNTLTDPAGFTNVFSLGTSGAAVNMSLSKKNAGEVTSFAATTASQSSSVGSVALHMPIPPNPS